MLVQTKTGEYGAQRIEFRLQSLYDRNATIHRGCIRIEASRHTTANGGRRQSDTAAFSNSKLALYVDDQYIDEHVVGARHVTTSTTPTALAAAPLSTERRSRSPDSRHLPGVLRWLK